VVIERETAGKILQVAYRPLLCVRVLTQHWQESTKQKTMTKLTKLVNGMKCIKTCFSQVYHRLCKQCVNPTSALAMQIYGDKQKSGHSLLVHHRAVQSCCQGSAFVFIQDVPRPPTVNQSCQCGAIQSSPHCCNIWEGYGDGVQSSIWSLQHGASNHIFGSSINWL
jgi:hypothetical protein